MIWIFRPYHIIHLVFGIGRHSFRPASVGCAKATADVADETDVGIAT
jgi:hypothetical protein